jgi:hypothetical protein
LKLGERGASVTGSLLALLIRREVLYQRRA